MLASAPGVRNDEAGRPSEGQQASMLFPTNLPRKEWAQFRAVGFAQPACGVIYRRAENVSHGMPLGGVSTGFLNLETNGTFGLCSIFNSGVPVRGPLRAPFLGLYVSGNHSEEVGWEKKEGKTWLLTSESVKDMLVIENAEEIHYWGHYPVADLEYETRAPVSIGMRAWTPFIPGDVLASNIPAAVFEVHLRNISSLPQQGTLAFNFPGPTQAEAQIAPESPREKLPMWFAPSAPVAQGVLPALKEEVSVGEFHGLSVKSEKGTGFALGVIGKQENLRFGGSLWFEGYEWESGTQWASIHQAKLPPTTETDFGSSVAVDFSLQPGETKIVRILLAWYSPIWKGEGTNYYARMYTKYYKDAVAVAEAVTKDHESLLRRILAWQEAVYTSSQMPVWLRDSLVNILHLISRTGYWAVAQAPLPDWCRPEDGLFGMTECPRECPQIECIPCSFYGNIPLPYFFPELALSTLRGYKGYQYANGAAPWIFGGCTGGSADGYRATDGTDMATPSPGYQTTLNGACYVDMVDRYWQRTGSDELLREFFPSVKKNTVYTMNLRSGPDGIVSVPEGNRNPTQPHGTPGMGLDWFESLGWFGMTPHVGGIHLAQVRMAQRMAEKVGDTAFVEQCKQWLKQGSESMENKLWTGQYYLAYYEPESGKKSELVFGYQLDGDWMCHYHGLPRVFRPDRAQTTLETIKRVNVPLSKYGVASFARPDGAQDASNNFYGVYTSQVPMVAGLYMYQGQRDVGLEMVQRSLHNLVIRLRKTWDMPVHLRADTGEVTFGADYYQNLMLWSLPAALEGKDIAAFCAPGGLIDRIVQAGKKA
jgi:non-lysosomal glucosylceramidase